MSRLMLAAPFFVAMSLAAQVPVAPPAPRTPPTPPVRPATAPTAPRAFQVDPVWIDDIAAQARSWSSDALDYVRLADDARFDAMNSLNAATFSLNSLDLSFDNFSLGNFAGFGGVSYGTGPVAWAQNDPADSLYKMARDAFSRGDYRRSADLFKSLPTKYPTSAYAADAMYWQAFSLYRIGGTPDLQQSLAVLEARKPDDRCGNRTSTRGSTSVSTTVNTTSAPRPMAYGSGNGAGFGNSYGGGYGCQTDAAGLAARVASVLSARGMSGDAAVKRALAAGGNSCNEDDQAVRAEALSAIMQNDPATGRAAATKILAARDECSVPLRRNAVMIVGNKPDDGAAATLVGVAKSDPSQSVRSTALDYLVRLQTDAAINAVVEVARTDTNRQIQRTAVRALARSSNARARTEVRSIVENNSADESLRISVIDGLDTDHITADDAAWLRALYAKTSSARIKERIISAVGRAGGDANNQWIQALLRNEDEPMESRTAALEHVGRTMDVASLIKTYDMAAQRPLRETALQLLAERKEPEALDKILDVAKNGTDTRMRTEAISILSRSKDPRATKLLLQLVDH